MQTLVREPSVRIDLVVDVVDGNGLPVPGEPVVVRHLLADGTERITAGLTDGDGRVRIDQEVPSSPVSIRLAAAGEETVMTDPRPGDLVTIEA